MPYELRIDGAPAGVFDTAEAAEAAARKSVRTQPDREPEIIDTATGEPYAPGASEAERDDLANRIGY